jgi:hypothetical protein
MILLLWFIPLLVNSTTCGGRIFRYQAPGLTAATTLSGAATGYQWILPSGTIGATCILDSGSLLNQ